MIEDLPPSLKGIFTETQRNFVVKSLSEAYITAIDCHDEARGSDEVTFGLGVYKHAVHEFTKPLDEDAPTRPFSIKSKAPMFKMSIDDFNFICHRVGKKASQDIRTSFPGNVEASKRMVEDQLWLEGMEPEKSLDMARNFVIAHMGNKDFGLEAVYLCIPKMGANGDIVDWAYSVPLWKTSSDTPPPTKSTPENHIPEEQIPDQIQLRKKNNKQKLFGE